MKIRRKAVAPVTISNINCGFDVLGMALDIVCDEIIAERIPRKGVELALYGENARQTPADPTSNTAGKAVLHYLKDQGLLDEDGIRLEIKKHVKPGSGLGASAASACAAIVLANKLYGTELTRRDLLKYAIEGERSPGGTVHADNIAPCLLGGTILVRDAESCDVHRIYTPEGLFLAIVLPELQVLTSHARELLSDKVSFAAAVQQSANLGAFVHAMHTSDLDLLRRTQTDLLVEPQRKHLIKGLEAVKNAAMGSGAIGSGVSGAGPAMYALCAERSVAEQVEGEMTEAFKECGVNATSFVTTVNHEGVTLC